MATLSVAMPPLKVSGNCEEENSLVGGVSDGESAICEAPVADRVASHSLEFPNILK